MINKNCNSASFLINEYEWDIYLDALFVVENENVRLIKHLRSARAVFSSKDAVNLIVALERTLLRNTNL